MTEQTKYHFHKGLRLAFDAVAGLCTMMLLGYGLLKLRFPEVDDSLLTFLKAKNRPKPFVSNQ
jgi:hypothetical protein